MAMATSMMLRRPVGGDQARVSRVAKNGWGACVVVPGGHCGSALGLSKGTAKRPRRVIMRAEPERAPKDAPKDVTEPAAEAAEAAKEVAKEAAKGPEAVSEPETAKGGAKNIDELPEIERAELSSGMKEKMKQEYLGLGGSENTAMGGNYFLYIIIIISVLAILSKLTGAI